MTLSDIRDAIRLSPLTIDRTSQEYAVISQAAVAEGVAHYQLRILREALEFYCDESNYDEGLPENSMMSRDRGKKAEYALRLTDPDPV